MSFSSLSLNTTLTTQLPATLTKTTPIQQQAIPAILKGDDLIALAQTGSGKTFAYLLPILNRLLSHNTNAESVKDIQAIIIVPTRELASQVSGSLLSLIQSLNITSAILSGGIPLTEQQQQLDSQPQIIVATPGRLLDLLNNEIISVDTVNCLVLDEADRLLEMGFLPDIEKIIHSLPNQRQTLLFSATFAEPLQKLTKQIFTKTPTRIELANQIELKPEINETCYLVNKGSKPQVLISQLKKLDHNCQALVFINSKSDVDKLTKRMIKAGFSVAALHGDKEQIVREQTLTDFKNRKINFLITTDLLARGVDIEALPLIINLELPTQAENYVHRIGRTARAGKSGEAISLVSHSEMEYFTAIKKLTQRELPLLELDDFPVTDKPTSGESKRSPRDKKANRRTAQKSSIKQFSNKKKVSSNKAVSSNKPVSSHKKANGNRSK
ncbi:DEAD/DEAH box helicase [Vibrio sp. SS-MA-C1-2]|uniref:DEAD/DEAH box helicase n=1 Tax=Vibrio sp. SS-MA-C1-2 TaxID=2908646 RepID=UPI001F2E95D2|nr:DEAD/DEAH box helicase [Vibrio sp. SS-MA-C1-2]UJF19735.1 DEAD/DEAH box helicase [Vibrio sp. SS-MA-C1-2]